MIIIGITLFFLALILALLEIEIEGKHGWAKKTNTWYIKSRIFGFFSNKKPLTGYHLFLLILIISFFHLPYIFGVEWNTLSQIQTIIYIILFFLVEDLLWFVLNPYYGLRKFNKESIWWYNKSYWIGTVIPVDYITALFSVMTLSFIAFALTQNIQYIILNLTLIGILFALIMLTAIILVKPYHAWYSYMRIKDQKLHYK